MSEYQFAQRLADDLAQLWMTIACQITEYGCGVPAHRDCLVEIRKRLQDRGVTPIRIPELIRAARELYEFKRDRTNRWGELRMDEDDWFEYHKMRNHVIGLARLYEVEPIEVPDLQPGQYMVTIRDDLGRVGYLLGPYGTHQEAIDNKPRARTLASKADPWSDFHAIGTVRFAPDATKLPPTVFGK